MQLQLKWGRQTAQYQQHFILLSFVTSTVVGWNSKTALNFNGSYKTLARRKSWIAVALFVHSIFGCYDICNNSFTTLFPFMEYSTAYISSKLMINKSLFLIVCCCSSVISRLSCLLSSGQKERDKKKRKVDKTEQNQQKKTATNIKKKFFYALRSG